MVALQTAVVLRYGPRIGPLGPAVLTWARLATARRSDRIRRPWLGLWNFRQLPSRNAERLEAFREKTSLQEARELCRIVSGHHVEVGFRCM